jgi:hypothetical protein
LFIEQIEKDQGIRTYKADYARKKLSKSKIRPPINLELINDWFIERYHIKSGNRGWYNRTVHYFFKSFKPLCASSSMDPLMGFRKPTQFGLDHRKCKTCLKVLSTYSNLDLRVLS